MKLSDTTSVWLQRSTERVDQAILRYFDDQASVASGLKTAMHYAATGGGKRVRPLLTYATASLAGKELDQVAGVDACAVALELFHTYSLVHDDLPCMDNDDLRRGRPTVHKAFDEASALLVGDALQTMAFQLIAQSALNDAQKVQVITSLSMAGGMAGMAGGQAIDLASVGKQLTQNELEQMHRLKTGALLRTAVQIGAIAIDLNEQEKKSLDVFASALGLAFQVVDDVLDASSDSQTLGKTAGKDAAANKPTFVSLMGLEGAREFARQLHQEALDSLSVWGENADLLRAIASKVVNRDS
ncbi:polyprenyl synthetase family protein [Polynucleobacter sp. MWH-CaK5]|uniref:polyprenyl synthetase family protein n=1 Tax=Polynucleobacter sp. MWH-CaK5 TaxID=2689107 RepID=UPI00203B4BFE|nr:farnesyl diphosphate synthase [Polynucleobacter sp. MWH-CaK5]